MTVASCQDVLMAAQQMPPDEQAELATAILQNLRGWLRTRPATRHDSDLIPLTGLNAAELRALADAVVASTRQATIHELLEKNRRGALSTPEKTALDELLAEADQVALLKARARYTLNLLGTR